MNKVVRRSELETRAREFVRAASNPPKAKGVRPIPQYQLEKLTTRVTNEAVAAVEASGSRVENE